MNVQSERRLIATAPLDGRPVLLFHPDWDTLEVGVYNADVARWQERTGDLLDAPTHWMLLPPPPESERPASRSF